MAPCLVEHKLRQILIRSELRGVGLLVFQQHEVLQHQNIHVGTHEAPVCLFRCAYDRLSADVEAGVDQHRATGLGLERSQQLVEPSVPLRVDGLHSRRAIDVRDRWDGTADALEFIEASRRAVSQRLLC